MDEVSFGRGATSVAVRGVWLVRDQDGEAEVRVALPDGTYRILFDQPVPPGCSWFVAAAGIPAAPVWRSA